MMNIDKDDPLSFCNSTRFAYNKNINLAEQLYNSLNEDGGVIDHRNKELDELLLKESKLLYMHIINDDLIDCMIEEFPYKFKLYEIDFSSIKNHWISSLYITITNEIYNYVDAAALDNANGSDIHIITENTKISPIEIKNGNLNHATILLNYNITELSVNIIYKIIRHELKHIFHRLKSKKANDEIYQNIIEFKEYINTDVPLFDTQDKNELIYNISNKASMEHILRFLYANSYLLNKSEIQAKLEDVNIDIKKYDSVFLTINKKLNPGIYNYFPVVSEVAEQYLQLFKTIILIRDYYDHDKVDTEIGKLYKLKELYHINFTSMFEVLNFFAYDIIFDLFIRHIVKLYDNECDKK